MTQTCRYVVDNIHRVRDDVTHSQEAVQHALGFENFDGHSKVLEEAGVRNGLIS